jgi:hypothetical protein
MRNLTLTILTFSLLGCGREGDPAQSAQHLEVGSGTRGSILSTTRPQRGDSITKITNDIIGLSYYEIQTEMDLSALLSLSPNKLGEAVSILEKKSFPESFRAVCERLGVELAALKRFSEWEIIASNIKGKESTLVFLKYLFRAGCQEDPLNVIFTLEQAFSKIQEAPYHISPASARLLTLSIFKYIATEEQMSIAWTAMAAVKSNPFFNTVLRGDLVLGYYRNDPEGLTRWTLKLPEGEDRNHIITDVIEVMYEDNRFDEADQWLSAYEGVLSKNQVSGLERARSYAREFVVQNQGQPSEAQLIEEAKKALDEIRENNLKINK